VLTGVGFAVFALLIVAIVLYLFEVAPDNPLVELVLDAAGWLGRPFEGLFDADDDKTQVLSDWGLAALVYAMAAVLVAAAIDRVARIGR
jgi:hypothetical protein